ncbi:Protein LURP-one-related 6 [Carex littledalei]|uniref:Protein LURP-one-related 6 n=1 Tax=Carex littledalei TaxID=544730 RepID=A0A833QXA6_9POAL|nr:Protein LURP-one-related 6 [Carex littledalei]
MDGCQKVIFRVEGCGILGVNGELIVRDGDGTAVLFIRKKGGVVQALSIHNRWRGYLMDYDVPSKPVFSLQDPKLPCSMINTPICIMLEPKGRKKNWDFEVIGSFTDRACTLKDRKGNVLAQVGAREMMAKNEFYHVLVQPGYDQAFVVGVLAILDNINGESTRC